MAERCTFVRLRQPGLTITGLACMFAKLTEIGALELRVLKSCCAGRLLPWDGSWKEGRGKCIILAAVARIARYARESVL